MFFSFVDALREAGIPASIKEHLILLQALDAEVIRTSPEEFYWLARATFVKDEALLDRFDLVFSKVFKGLEGGGEEAAKIPEEWLRKVAELYLTPEQMAEIQALGSWDEIMAALQKRLEEQQGRHQGGSKWIGTAGTSPFGAYGYNPEGIRIGQEGGRNRSAIKVWDKREFRNLDSSRELGTRNIKVAMRRLRRFAREGAAEELDMDGTIDGTARRGWLDIRMRPERHNAVKLLLFLDVGGSMDPHVRLCEELFSAATAEFRNLEFFYFHNCLYESVWKDNRRRFAERIPTWDLLHKYGHDYKLVFVGDAAMSPYEVSHPGGSVEHFNEEAGAVWLKRATETWRQAVWLNPMEERYWDYSASTQLVRALMGERMFPLTLDGLDDAMRSLGRKS
jgi:uncharacterized protein with von Willebrand factor type A (vWA) domain